MQKPRGPESNSEAGRTKNVQGKLRGGSGRMLSTTYSVGRVLLPYARSRTPEGHNEPQCSSPTPLPPHRGRGRSRSRRLYAVRAEAPRHAWPSPPASPSGESSSNCTTGSGTWPTATGSPNDPLEPGPAAAGRGSPFRGEFQGRGGGEVRTRSPTQVPLGNICLRSQPRHVTGITHVQGSPASRPLSWCLAHGRRSGQNGAPTQCTGCGLLRTSQLGPTDSVSNKRER